MRSHAQHRAGAGGFTLIELMVVVVIIAILATLAVPQFVSRFRDRRVNQAAQSTAELLRGARARALGRGAAVMVMYKSDGSFEVREGVKGTTAATAEGVADCGNLPTRGCTLNDWNLASGSIGTARRVGGLALSGQHTRSAVLGSTAVTSFNVCFSPSGRSFVNQTSTWTPADWTPLSQVATITTSRTGGRSYQVLLLPNGTARMAL